MSERPAWIDVLETEAKRTSQRRAGKRINYSAAVVSQVINGGYAGDMGAVEAAVRGALMGEHLTCPELGVIRRDQCIGWQRQRLNSASPMNARMWRACRSGCMHSRLEPNDD